MGKRISVILIVVLAAAAVTFGVLWQSALRNHSDIKALAQAGANEACSRFSDFQKRGDGRVRPLTGCFAARSMARCC